jgi:squalene-hopene/tetraprenyl-beta-curcumene cyclase
MTRHFLRAAALAAPVAILAAAACSQPEARAAGAWNRSGATVYLDRRADWWMQWPAAARDHQTSCMSCHTTLPYALARGVLRQSGDAPSSGERRVWDNVAARVRLWNDVEPYYHDRAGDAYKSTESRGTEAVLNALILTVRDRPAGRLSAEAAAALEHMWTLQQTSGDSAGAWPWLQFGLKPWETADSAYFGAALAALAVGEAPEAYRANDAVRDHLARLQAYLNRGAARQPLANRIMLLWATTKWTDLVDAGRPRAIVDEILRAQRSDGGWGLAALVAAPESSSIGSSVRAWYHNVRSTSDGCATGLATFVLLEAGRPRTDAQVERGLAWLVRNQDEEGFWRAASLNKERDPSSDVGRFMSDAATAYAGLALARAGLPAR